MRNYKQEYIDREKQDPGIINVTMYGVQYILKINKKEKGRELIISIKNKNVLHKEFEYTGLYNTNTYLKKILIREITNERRRQRLAKHKA